MTLDKHVVHTSAAPAAVGPYSQAIRVSAGQMIFCSGQIGLDPETGVLAEGLEAQTRAAMDNLRAVIGAAGATMNHVVRTTLYLTDMADYVAVNTIYESYFPSVPPARAAVQVSALPKGAKFEVDAIVVL